MAGAEGGAPADVIAPRRGVLLRDKRQLGSHPPELRHGPRYVDRRRRGQAGGRHDERPIHRAPNGITPMTATSRTCSTADLAMIGAGGARASATSTARRSTVTTTSSGGTAGQSGGRSS